MPLLVEDFAKHLNGVPAEDIAGVLPRILNAAENHVLAMLGKDHTAAQPVVDQAILMLAAHWYENREASVIGVSAQSLPLWFDDLIANHRNYTFGLSDNG